MRQKLKKIIQKKNQVNPQNQQHPAQAHLRHHQIPVKRKKLPSMNLQ